MNYRKLFCCVLIPYELKADLVSQSNDHSQQGEQQRIIIMINIIMFIKPIFRLLSKHFHLLTNRSIKYIIVTDFYLKQKSWYTNKIHRIFASPLNRKLSIRYSRCLPVTSHKIFAAMHVFLCKLQDTVLLGMSTFAAYKHKC